jgi:predicted Zn-dependent protease
MKNEAELAGVLGHEITHVTEKHTVDAIRRARASR